MPRKSLRFERAPKPDVSVKKQLHREASQSSQLPVGPTMSPMILPVPTMDPSCLPVAFPGEGGTTSATGLPKRVTRTGLRVLRTSSRMPRHLALNTEMAISFTLSPEQNLYHGQQPCSRIMDTVFPFKPC